MLRKSLGLLPVLFSAVLPLSATTIFTDSTFTPGNYSQVIYNTDPGDVTIAFSQTASGNPGNAGEVTNTWSTPNITFTTITGLINTTFLYNPSTQGPIQSIDLSVDRYITLVGGTLGGTNNGTVLLLQNGKYYFDQITGPALVAGTFQTISAAGLLASDFQLLDFTTGTADGTQHPDFSASGGLIDFGTRVSFGHINAVNSAGNLDVRLDNLTISLTTTPEPSAYGLVAAGLAGLWFLRRRRARS
jgi:hypothetical protein